LRFQQLAITIAVAILFFIAGYIFHKPPTEVNPVGATQSTGAPPPDGNPVGSPTPIFDGNPVGHHLNGNVTLTIPTAKAANVAKAANSCGDGDTCHLEIDYSAKGYSQTLTVPTCPPTGSVYCVNFTGKMKLHTIDESGTDHLEKSFEETGVIILTPTPKP
jgi:hypothetical protein